MSESRCIIVGASHAGSQLAASLRQQGWQEDITIIGDEPNLPYHRPPLSKAYLSGEMQLDDILLRPHSFYEKQNIHLMLGGRVESIDRMQKRVRLDDGAELVYDKLALTTGARVRTLDVPGAKQAGVYYLRKVEDVDKIRHYVASRKKAVIIGGGYIGLETAAALRKAGMDVTVVESMQRVLQRITTPEVSAFYTRVHEEEGVRILTNTAVQSLEGDGEVSAVLLANGERLPADLVIVGIGIIPDTDLAERIGLDVNNGIVVDEYARTSDHDIVAAGDCTWHYNPIYQRHLRLESVQNAIDQGKVAAATLCGKLQPYNALPWFWSDQYGMKLQIAGLCEGFDQVVVRGNMQTSRNFAIFYLREGKLLAVDAVNRPKEFMICRRALLSECRPDLARLADESIEVQALFTT